ncbi:MAG TPA: 50S ribosomal protein L3 [Candidatus Woesebacteria bacterium]|nr:50S ribosomal protein L3 [Candidatus Woesebacteria bacterium]
MLTDFFAIKTGMTQAWTKDGRRLAVTKLQANDNILVSQLNEEKVVIGYGRKQAKNVNKPQRAQFQKGGFVFMPARTISTNVVKGETAPSLGESVKVSQVFQVGDLVDVQGVTKGRGFAGAMKRYGFKGGPKTHGQSDRSRAPGSIGSGTTPGRVWKGKRMPGHYGVNTQTVKGLVVLHVDAQTNELWVSGPVPGHIQSFIRIHKTGQTKNIELNKKASGITAVTQTEDSVKNVESQPNSGDDLAAIQPQEIAESNPVEIQPELSTQTDKK